MQGSRPVSEADLNLGIHLLLNGSPVSAIQLDTTQAATDTIDYVATDQLGRTATTTRTVVVAAPDSAESPTGSTSARTVVVEAAQFPSAIPPADTFAPATATTTASGTAP
jgi:hypothetical protein